MVRHKILSIKEKGGLRVHLAELGIDYDYFISLDDPEVSDTTIAHFLNKKYPKREKPLHRTTIGGWRTIRKKEQLHAHRAET